MHKYSLMKNSSPFFPFFQKTPSHPTRYLRSTTMNDSIPFPCQKWRTSTRSGSPWTMAILSGMPPSSMLRPHWNAFDWAEESPTATVRNKEDLSTPFSNTPRLSSPPLPGTRPSTRCTLSMDLRTSTIPKCTATLTPY